MSCQTLIDQSYSQTVTRSRFTMQSAFAVFAKIAHYRHQLCYKLPSIECVSLPRLFVWAGAEEEVWQGMKKNTEQNGRFEERSSFSHLGHLAMGVSASQVGQKQKDAGYSHVLAPPLSQTLTLIPQNLGVLKYSFLIVSATLPTQSPLSAFKSMAQRCFIVTSVLNS